MHIPNTISEAAEFKEGGCMQQSIHGASLWGNTTEILELESIVQKAYAIVTAPISQASFLGLVMQTYTSLSSEVRDGRTPIAKLVQKWSDKVHT